MATSVSARARHSGPTTSPPGTWPSSRITTISRVTWRSAVRRAAPAAKGAAVQMTSEAGERSVGSNDRGATTRMGVPPGVSRRAAARVALAVAGTLASMTSKAPGSSGSEWRAGRESGEP